MVCKTTTPKTSYNCFYFLNSKHSLSTDNQALNVITTRDLQITCFKRHAEHNFISNFTTQTFSKWRSKTNYGRITNLLMMFLIVFNAVDMVQSLSNTNGRQLQLCANVTCKAKHCTVQSIAPDNV